MSNFDSYETFDYVLKVEENQKICFGSKLLRDTNPIGRGRSPYQKIISPEIFPNVGPSSYPVERRTGAQHKMFHKITSKAGFGPLASKEPRLKDRIIFRTPSPGRYDNFVKWDTGRKCLAPFGVSSKVRQVTLNSTPSPATYDIRKIQKCRRTRFMYNFGKPQMIESIKTICVTKPIDTCSKCEKLCKGDYWHKDMTIYLCQPCWNEEKLTREIYDEKGLKQFKKIRNCSFMHNHEKTTAALRILPPNKIKKKVRLENYLDMYIKC